MLCTPAGFRRWLAQASPATKRQVLVDWIEQGVIERHPDGHKLTLTVRTPKGLVVTHDAKGIGVLCAGAHELSFNSFARCERVARSLSAIR